MEIEIEGRIFDGSDIGHGPIIYFSLLKSEKWLIQDVFVDTRSGNFQKVI